MRLCRLIGGWLLLAPVVMAQELAPDVLLLARIKSHMRDELAHLPNYTCLETITRFRKEPGRPSPFQGELKPFDTVRLEIVYTDHREWYGSPGDRNLSADNPVDFVGSGMIGSGAFGLLLNNIFEAAMIKYVANDVLDSRKTARYDFHLSQVMKGLSISLPGGTGTVGEKGAFWADPQSLDLVRLESNADEIPPYLPLERASTTVNYARTRIGEHDVLLAQEAAMRMLETSGAESYDRIDFTHCRAYSSQSVIRFEPDPEAAPPVSSKGVSAPDAATLAIPPFLPMTLQLTTPITEKDAVGTLIEGRVSGAVLYKGKTIVPDGSIVRGRIRRLERYHGNGGKDYIVGLEFTEVDARGSSLRFYADLLRIERNPAVRPTLSERVLVRDAKGEYQTSNTTITLPELPGVASFFVSGPSFSLSSGLRMVWRTRGLIR